MMLVSFAPETDEAASLPTPEDLQKEIPLTDAHAAFISRSRESIEAILNGWDKRLLIIAGPCSIHDLEAAREYGKRFRKLAEKVADRFFLVMRTYFEKPRTIVGWKGLLYDPDLDGTYNFAKGIRQTRELLRDLTEMGVPAGCELLEINTATYYSDYLSWGCIGARTCSSPPHRQLAASLNFPIGFKNTIDGNVDPSIHGIIAAAVPHTYLGISPSGQMVRMQADGNAMGHIILRGGVTGPNYQPKFIQKTILKCRKAKVRERLVIDCSHGNCGKKHQDQVAVFQEVLEHAKQKNSPIAGLMLESNLHSGAQELSFPLSYGVSITDPCIDWETTESIIMHALETVAEV